MNVTDTDTMRSLQGDRVLIYRHAANNGALLLAHVMTLVRRIDVGGQELRLVNKDERTGQPDWAFTQNWLDKLRPAPANKHNAKWQVTLKFAAKWE